MRHAIPRLMRRLMRRWRGGGNGPTPSSRGAATAGEIDPYDARLDDELKELDD